MSLLFPLVYSASHKREKKKKKRIRRIYIHNKKGGIFGREKEQLLALRESITDQNRAWALFLFSILILMSFGGLFDGGGGGSSGAFPFGSATMPPGAVSQPRTLSPAISKAGFSTSPALSLGLVQFGLNYLINSSFSFLFSFVPLLLFLFL